MGLPWSSLSLGGLETDQCPTSLCSRYAEFVRRGTGESGKCWEERRKRHRSLWSRLCYGLDAIYFQVAAVGFGSAGPIDFQAVDAGGCAEAEMEAEIALG